MKALQSHSSKALVVVAVALCAAAPRESAAQTQASALQVSAARFWRSDGSTLIDGLITYPVQSVDSSARTFVLEIRDAKGSMLHHEEWSDTMSASLEAFARAQPGAMRTTPITVALGPGRYDLTVHARSSQTDDSVRVALEPFAAKPLMSDVIVAPLMRVLGPEEKAAAGEATRGRYAFTRAVKPVIRPEEPNLWYYVELYAPDANVNAVDLTMEITRPEGGTPVFRTRRSVAVNERGGVDAARISVQGLPPGEYLFSTTATAGGRSEKRSAAFRMDTLTVPVVAMGAGTSEEQLYQKYFAPAVLTNAAVTEQINALIIAAPGAAVPSSTATLPPDAQRRFLARYWARIPDPNPQTEGHEFLEEYAQRAEFVGREFGERQIGRSGARTDRGRIYLKYGAPDLKQTIPMSSGRASVEVWKYTRRRNIKFAFLDATGFQNYVLLYTTDPVEQSLPDWQDKIDPREKDVLNAILNF